MLSGSNNVNAVVLQLFPFFWSFISDDGLEKQMLNLDFNFWRPVAIKVLDEEVPKRKRVQKRKKFRQKWQIGFIVQFQKKWKKSAQPPFWEAKLNVTQKLSVFLSSRWRIKSDPRQQVVWKKFVN